MRKIPKKTKYIYMTCPIELVEYFEKQAREELVDAVARARGEQALAELAQAPQIEQVSKAEIIPVAQKDDSKKAVVVAEEQPDKAGREAREEAKRVSDLAQWHASKGVQESKRAEGEDFSRRDIGVARQVLDGVSQGAQNLVDGVLGLRIQLNGNQKKPRSAAAQSNDGGWVKVNGQAGK